MRKLCLVLSALVILWCPFTTAAQVDFSSSIDVFLKSTLKGEDKLFLEARGDLNSDGLVDWAGVVRSPRSIFSPKLHISRAYQLYVLLRQPQGGYSVAEKTNEEEMGGMGNYGLEDLKIRRSSIYIQTYAKSLSTMDEATHQFKLYKGEWRLVGIRIHSTDFTPRATTETHMNFLTGAVIEKRRKGKNKPITRRRNKNFATYLLKDFGFFSEFGIE